MDWDTNTAETTRIVLAQNIAAQSEWPRDEVNLAVELRAERKVIGSIRLAVIDGDNGNADFGFVFNRRYWNNGYATEAARAILDVAFSVLRLHRVIATCDVRNGASSRVMEKLAMRREGHFLQDRMQKGEWRDSYLYGILAHEWRLLVHNRTID